MRLGELRPLLSLIASAGLDAARLLSGAGLRPDLFDGADDEQLPLSAYFRLRERMALDVGDETTQVSLRPLMIGTSAFVGERLRACRTLGEASELLAGCYNMFFAGRYNRVERESDSLSYVMDDRRFPYAFQRDDRFLILLVECLLIHVHVLLSALAGGTLPLKEIRTRGSATGRGLDHLRFWRVPIRFDAPAFALHYQPDVDGRPLASEDPCILRSPTLYGGVAAELERMAPPAVAQASVAVAVLAALQGGAAGQEDVAAGLGISVASLRRRLDGAGTSFRALRADALSDMACRRLAGGEPIGQVAEALGFSDRRSFSRAFRQWRGRSPTEWLESHNSSIERKRSLS